jgi:hypothetical protein
MSVGDTLDSLAAVTVRLPRKGYHMKVVYRIGLLIAALACCASLIPTVASAAYIPSYSGGSSYSSSYYRPSYYSSLYRPSYYRPSYYRPSYPSYYGQLNRAGYPKNQYVSPYFRSNGTYVGGYWRNSPNDSYRTCSIIRC